MSKLHQNWKSELSKNKNLWTMQLTDKMKTSLAKLSADKTEKEDIHSSTVKALKKRGFLTEDGLSEFGLILGLSYCNLEQQIEQLDIPVNEWEVNKKEECEKKLVRKLNSKGKEAYFTENKIIPMLESFFLVHKIDEVIDHENEYSCINPMETPGGTMFPELSYDLEEPRVASVLKENLEKYRSQITSDTAKENRKLLLESVYSEHKKNISDLENSIMPEESLNMVLNIFDHLGKEKLFNLFDLYYSNRSAYRKGWPDLIVLQKENSHFLEVKRKRGSLNLNQLITIHDLRQRSEIEVKCGTVKKADRQ